MSGTPLTGRVALGTASLSFSPERDRDADLGTLRAGLDAGATIVDTARAYGRVDDPSFGERLTADAVAGRDVIVMTKGGHARIAHDTWDVDLAPDRIRSDLEGSLAVLGRIDVYFLHRVDLALAAGQRFEPAVDALAAFRDQGRIGGVGLSNVTVADLETASAITGIDAVQNRHDAINLQSSDVLAWCTERGIPFFAYSPLPRGARTPHLAAAAAARGASVQRLLLRALLESSPVLSVITGATRPASVVDSVAAQTEAWDDGLETAYRDDLALEKER